jgi:hypothetical protein
MVGYMTSGHGPLHVLRTYQQRNTFDEAQTTPLRISNIGSAKIVVDCPDICTRDHRRRNEHEYPLADTGGRESFLKGVRWELKTD